MKKTLVLIFLFMKIQPFFAQEFIYPVVKLDEQNIFVIHQKSIHDVSLFLWNTESKIATKELSSIFLPSYIKILPQKMAFSFIDQGRIRIKQFQKRAPKTIDISEPVHSIISMDWVSDEQFYFVAKYKKNYKIFLCELLDLSYQLFHMTNFDNVDYIYPCKVQDRLFCISKNTKSQYSVIELPWNPTLYGKPRNHQDQNSIFESQEPLCFLHMKNATEGYFLKNNNAISQDEKCLYFTCCRCKKADNAWHIDDLFVFKLPKSYVTGDYQERAYESIYPFLPNYDHSEYIFFVNYSLGGQCFVNRYEIKTGITQEQLIRRMPGDVGFLAPIILKDTVFHGLIVSSKISTRSTFEMNQQSGFFDLNLPKFMTS